MAARSALKSAHVVAAWLSGALALFSGGLVAQATATLAGTIVDDGSGAPVEGASVLILGLDLLAKTNERGEFTFGTIPAGRLTLRYDSPAHPSVVEDVEVGADEVAFLQIRLAGIEAVLQELIVTAERTRTGTGTSETVIRGGPGDARTAADLLAEQVPGVSLRRNDGSAAGGARLRLRGTNSMTVGDAPAIYVDGILVSSREKSLDLRASSGLHVLEQIPASSVERIRVLRGPAAAAQYPSGFGGVIVIETRKGPTANRAK
jgi:outer membrane receptor protein involved in Fe transport